MCVDIMLHWF